MSDQVKKWRDMTSDERDIVIFAWLWAIGLSILLISFLCWVIR
jgi:hypothetical protein